jgi:arylsulfatase
VILVVVDTLRADHLSCYGYPRATSPNLDGLARDGALFERVVSASAFTGPSVASIHTGRYPRFHSFGVANGAFRLGPEERTLAEEFVEAGYRTGAIVCNPVLPARYGFDQGFEEYDERMEEREHIRGVPERNAAGATDAAIDWLAGLEEGQPFFLWIHYMDPHGPYTPPKDLQIAFAREDSERAGQEVPPPPRQGADSGHGYVPWYQAIGERHFLDEYVGRYDAEIASVDRELGRLLDRLRAQGRYDETVILLTADHGEALGDEGFFFCHGHGLTPDQTFVPMILKHPLVSAGTRASTPVGHVDVYPTLLAEVGLPEGEVPWGAGLDLVSALAAAPAPRPLYCEIRKQLGVYAGDVALLTRSTGDSPSSGPDSGIPGRFLRLGGEASDVPTLDRERLLACVRAYQAQPSAASRETAPAGSDLRTILNGLGYAGDEDPEQH